MALYSKSNLSLGGPRVPHRQTSENPHSAHSLLPKPALSDQWMARFSFTGY
jgi:hypothetical protein